MWSLSHSVLMLVLAGNVAVDDIVPFYKQESCSDDNLITRQEHVKKAECGPKEVLVPLKTRAAYEAVFPSAVMVKRCVGICSLGTQVQCLPTSNRTIEVPVRLYSEATEMESCVLFPVVEHVACQCFCRGDDDCV